MAKEGAEETNRLNLEISKLRSAITVSETELEKLRAEVGRLKAENFSLLKDKEVISEENLKLKGNISRLEGEKAEMEKRVEALESEVRRPKLSPEQLTTSLRDAISKMEEGLKISGGRVDYTLGKFDADIKATLTIADNSISIKLPYIGETVAPENLSTIKISLKAVPKLRVPLIRVPLVIGMSKDSAFKATQDLGLLPVVEERQSKTSPGTIIGQKPEAYSEVPPETIITLIAAIPERVKVPNLINMDVEVATRILKEFDLAVGKIERKLEKIPPNTVIGQSPLTDTEVNRGSPVDLIVSAQGVKVPDVKGMKESGAKEAIEKVNLKVGNVSFKRHLFVDGLVISQSPEADNEVLQGSEVDITVARKMSFQELKEAIKSRPEAKRLEAVLDLVFVGLEKLGIDKADRLRDLLETPDSELVKKLGLKGVSDIAHFKKLMKRIFEEME